MIVARDHVTPEEIHRSTQELIEANVPHFAKIIDVAGATSELTQLAQNRHVGSIETMS